jgi:hypothetical protein
VTTTSSPTSTRRLNSKCSISSEFGQQRSKYLARSIPTSAGLEKVKASLRRPSTTLRSPLKLKLSGHGAISRSMTPRIVCGGYS